MRTLGKASKLGLCFFIIHLLLVLLIPLWVKILGKGGCGLFPCLFTPEEWLFMFFNIPGLMITSIEPVNYLLDQLKPEAVKLSGEIYIIDNIAIFIISSILYYLSGFMIGKFGRSVIEILIKIYQMKSVRQFSKVGLRLVVTYIIIVFLIILWAGIFESECIHCKITPTQGYFFLLSMPGFLLIKLFVDRDNFFISDYSIIVIVSCLTYYIVGYLIEKLWKKLRG